VHSCIALHCADVVVVLAIEVCGSVPISMGVPRHGFV